MNFSNGIYLYNGITGTDSSKGEPKISKAFTKLFRKIKDLEQLQHAERENMESGNPSNEDSNLSEVRSKILTLQIQHLRKVLKENTEPKELYPENEDPVLLLPSEKRSVQRKMEAHRSKHDSGTNTVAALQSETVPKSLFPSEDPGKHLKFKVSVSVNKKTQTGTSFVDENSERNEQILDDAKKCDRSKSFPAPTTSSTFLFPRTRSLSAMSSKASSIRRAHSFSSTSKWSTTRRSNPQSHYHLKLDDVPFILAASTSASHSVVANVQTIIGKMKQHNKALCGGKACKFRSRNLSSGGTVRKMTESEENAQIMKNLQKIVEEQKKFQKTYDAHTSTENKKAHETAPKVQGISSIFLGSEENESRSHKSTRSSARNQHMEPKRRPVPVSARNKAGMSTLLGRSNLVHSLQDLKTQLTLEDISWE